MRAHARPIAHDQGSGIDVRFATSADEIAAAVELLDRAEAEFLAPLVDEAERVRLERVAHLDLDRDAHWHPLLAWRDEPVAYAGLSLAGGLPTADVVVRDVEVVGVLLEALRIVAGDHEATELLAWLRHVDRDTLDMAGLAGWSLRRRLFVLRRRLSRVPVVAVPLPRGVSVRHHDGSARDDIGVAAVLGRAYAGTADDTWTPEEVADRRGYDWFRAEDLLVAEDGGRIVAIHWTKRRDHGVGEVYNLAVDPAAQGRGLGAALLDAGLVHLAAVGCDQVVLWVDEDNGAARGLYATRGFAEAWQDVALGCETCAPSPPA